MPTVYRTLIRLSDISFAMQMARIVWIWLKHCTLFARASLGFVSVGSSSKVWSCFFTEMCWLANSNRNSRRMESRG